MLPIAERLPTLIVCLCMLAGCARSAVEELTTGSGIDGTEDAGKGASDAKDGGDDDASVAARDAGNNPMKDAGMSTPKPDAGTTTPMPDAGSPMCTNPALTCASAVSVGEIDASDSASKVTHQAKGNGWFAVDLKDGNKDNTMNARIGVGVTLTAPSGATYVLTVMGDTSPNGGGRCIKSDVTSPEPLSKTATWGSYGPNISMTRLLAIHVEHMSGPCDAAWTLTIAGNPCPGFFGAGENSAGSCP